MEIRELNDTEIGTALELAWEVFLEFEAPDYPPQGVEAFRHFLDDPDEIGKLRFTGAWEQGLLLGILAMREDHIGLLFVKRAFHRRGIAKALLGLVSDRSVTVNSSPYAVDIYRKLGFTATDAEQTVNGIRFTPMVCIRG